MTASFTRLDEKSLTARVVDAFVGTRRLAYAQLSPALTMVQVSSNFAAVTMLPPQTAVLGEPLANVLWEFVGAEPLLAAVLQGKRPVYRLENVQRPQADDSLSYLTFQVQPVSPQRPQDGLLLMVEDTTENGRLQQSLVQDRNELRLLQQQLGRANESLQQLDRLKSLFLSIAAHELRTPLSAIFGYADLLLNSLPADAHPDRQDFLEVIRAQAGRLSRQITDILSLDQIERGQLAIHPAECDLNELVREAIDVLTIEADKREVTLTTSLLPRPLLLWADPERITQILYNLVGNALKYTLSGGTVTVSLQQDGETAVVRISDSGLGMNREQAANLFQLYYRTEEATANKIMGTGLGLYIVKTLVDAHNGRIEVESAREVGTTFTVYLPALDPELIDP